MATVKLKHAAKKIVKSFKELLSLVFVLAFVAGLINSVGFLGFGQFVSHLSGHATYAAVEYSQKNYFLALTSLSAVLFFIAGAAFTAILLRGKTLEDVSVTYAWPLLFEMLLIFYVVLNWIYYKELKLQESSFGRAHYFLSLSFAMGMQNATLRRSSSQTLRTTHITGVGTDIGIALGSGVSWGIRTILDRFILHWKSGEKISKAPRIFIDSIKAAYVHSKAEKLFLHVSTLVAFAIGAAVGTFGFLFLHFMILFVPIGILNVIILYEFSNRLKSRSFD